MNKTYSNDEIHEILHSLFLEKRKATDLEQQLNELIARTAEEQEKQQQEASAFSEEAAKLKQAALIFKKKFEESADKLPGLEARCEELSVENDSLKHTQHALSLQLNQTLIQSHHFQQNIETYQAELGTMKALQEEEQEELIALRDQLMQLRVLFESANKDAESRRAEIETIKQKESQLERVVHFLRKRVEEAHLENQALTTELNTSQKLIKTLSEELNHEQNAVAAARHQLQDKDYCIETLHKEKGEFSVSQGNLTEEMQTLKNSHDHLQCSLQGLNEDKQALEVCLKEVQEALMTSHKEAEMARQMMLKSIQEAKHEMIIKENDYLKKIQEMEANYASAIHAAWENTEKQESMLSEKSALLEEANILLAQKEVIEKQQGMELDELTIQLREVSLSKKLLQENLAALKMQTDEEESRLKTAQQHLAKKMRESTLLSEKCEEQQGQMLELQNQVNQSKLKISELQTNLEMEAQHQRRLQEQLADNLRMAEAQSSKWEEKYLKIYEKWQEAESNIRALKVLEERYQHLQQVFANAGNVLGVPLSMLAPAMPRAGFLAEMPHPQPEPPLAPAPHPIQASLFEAKSKPSHFKETFFER